MYDFVGRLQGSAWQGFPLATAQEAPQAMAAEREVGSLNYTKLQLHIRVQGET